MKRFFPCLSEAGNASRESCHLATTNLSILKPLLDIIYHVNVKNVHTRLDNGSFAFQQVPVIVARASTDGGSIGIFTGIIMP